MTGASDNQGRTGNKQSAVRQIHYDCFLSRGAFTTRHTSGVNQLSVRDDHDPACRWISGRIVSLQPDTDIQKLLSNGNRIRIRISETLLSILRGFRLLETVAHCTIIHLLFSEASFQPSVP